MYNVNTPSPEWMECDCLERESHGHCIACGGVVYFWKGEYERDEYTASPHDDIA
jgi:hypothetical protein